MHTFKNWLTTLIAILLLPNVATSADLAKEAYETGKRVSKRRTSTRQ